MKNVYVLLLLNVWFISTEAQSFGWAKREGLWAYDYGYGSTTDNAGNLYVAGKYEENANFSNTILPCQGNHDIYLVKYSPAGAMQWVTTGGGTLGDYAEGVTTDGSSYVCIAGEIEGVNNPISFQNSNITLTTRAENDIFIAKYDLNGNLIWARQAGWYQNDKALAITHDNSGNIYISGFFNDTCMFGTNTFVYGSGANDIYLAKYDANGNFQWVRRAGGTGRDEAKGVVCDASGNVYICGMFENTAQFGNISVTSPGTYFDSFIAKYDANGNVQWVKTGSSPYDEVAWGITKDNAGRLYIAGEFNAYAVFDNIALTTAGWCDAFVACYDANGAIQWAKRAGGTMVDRARGIGTDGNNLYITGQFGSTASFGSSSVTAMDSSDIFIAKIDNAGNWQWSMSVGGSPDVYEPLGYESGNTICSDALGNVYASGALLDDGVFGSTTLTTYDRTDMFVAKIVQVGVGMPETDANATLQVYPNPSSGSVTVSIGEIQDQYAKVELFDCTGRSVMSRQVGEGPLQMDLGIYGKGIYMLQVSTGGSTMRERVIVQ
jgi:hypothetical protein